MRFAHARRPTAAIDFLPREGGAATLVPAAARLLRLQADLFALAPAALQPTLRSGCDVAASGEREIVLFVASASIAAKLRQLLPRLSEGLGARGWHVDEIRVRVRPRPSGPPARISRQLSISSIGVAAFARLGAGMEESALKDAVERLVKRRSS